MGDPTSGWENQDIYRKARSVCVKKPVGMFFSSLEKKKEYKEYIYIYIYSMSASDYGPHAAIFSNSDPLGNDGHETNLQKHEINIKIETLKV